MTAGPCTPKDFFPDSIKEEFKKTKIQAQNIESSIEKQLEDFKLFRQLSNKTLNCEIIPDKQIRPLTEKQLQRKQPTLSPYGQIIESEYLHFKAGRNSNLGGQNYNEDVRRDRISQKSGHVFFTSHSNTPSNEEAIYYQTEARETEAKVNNQIKDYQPQKIFETQTQNSRKQTPQMESLKPKSDSLKDIGSRQPKGDIKDEDLIKALSFHKRKQSMCDVQKACKDLKHELKKLQRKVFGREKAYKFKTEVLQRLESAWMKVTYSHNDFKQAIQEYNLAISRILYHIALFEQQLKCNSIFPGELQHKLIDSVSLMLASLSSLQVLIVNCQTQGAVALFQSGQILLTSEILIRNSMLVRDQLAETSSNEQFKNLLSLIYKKEDLSNLTFGFQQQQMCPNYGLCCLNKMKQQQTLWRVPLEEQKDQGNLGRIKSSPNFEQFHHQEKEKLAIFIQADLLFDEDKVQNEEFALRKGIETFLNNLGELYQIVILYSPNQKYCIEWLIFQNQCKSISKLLLEEVLCDEEYLSESKLQTQTQSFTNSVVLIKQELIRSFFADNVFAFNSVQHLSECLTKGSQRIISQQHSCLKKDEPCIYQLLLKLFKEKSNFQNILQNFREKFKLLHFSQISSQFSFDLSQSVEETFDNTNLN